MRRHRRVSTTRKRDISERNVTVATFMPMSATQYIPDSSFAPAPAGFRVRLKTMLVGVIAVAAGVVLAVMVLQDPHAPGAMVAAGGVSPVALAIALWTAHIRRYRLTGDELLVEFRFRTVRLSLTCLGGAEADRDAMRRAWKVWGNDGVGAYSGRFRSRRLGRFRAYLTDADRAVVLRWPDRCVVISPDQPSYFLEAVRKRAGLAR